MNTRPPYYAIIAQQIGTQLIVASFDVHTIEEYNARASGEFYKWSKLFETLSGNEVQTGRSLQETVTCIIPHAKSVKCYKHHDGSKFKLEVNGTLLVDICYIDEMLPDSKEWNRKPLDNRGVS